MQKTEPTLLWLFFSFKGRIARQSFVLGAGFLLLPQIFILLQMVKHENNSDRLLFWFVVLILALALSLWSILSLFVKRLHDLSLPGMLSIIAVFSGINLIFFIALALLPSKQETNEYGPPPFPID